MLGWQCLISSTSAIRVMQAPSKPCSFWGSFESVVAGVGSPQCLQQDSRCALLCCPLAIVRPLFRLYAPVLGRPACDQHVLQRRLRWRGSDVSLFMLMCLGLGEASVQGS